MRRAEIAANLARIIEFSGVADFIDTPVKWYSSGMYVRLGFAVAAHLEADILLVDEVLSVGDEQFQRRCLERVEELRRAGTTIIIISHDLASIARVCERVVLLERGRVEADGEPASVIAEYRRRLIAESSAPRVEDARFLSTPVDHSLHV
jgi:ABC-type polysaccharide/polyol phosphate transport system ATPase subunit